jgi:archaellum component FlaC
LIALVVSDEESRGDGVSIENAPDPTQRTIDTLHREVAGLREVDSLLIKGIEQITSEKFRSVDTRFELIERQRVEQKADTKAAVDAALTAQKEAVREQTIASERAIAKSETATSKQLDQMTATFTASIGGVTDLLNDAKDRIGKIDTRLSNIETAKQTVTETNTTHMASNSQTIAIAAIVAGLLGGGLGTVLLRAFGG